MKVALLLVLLGFVPQKEVPYKPSGEFQIEVEYKFKQRPLVDNSASINFDETRKDHDRKQSSAVLPYLIINLKLLKLSEEEVKIRGVDNMGDVRLTKKAELDKQYKLDLGFTDDMKDKVTANEYTILFLSSDKKKHSRIILFVGEDGTFLVNGEKRGKF